MVKDFTKPSTSWVAVGSLQALEDSRLERLQRGGSRCFKSVLEEQCFQNTTPSHKSLPWLPIVHKLKEQLLFIHLASTPSLRILTGAETKSLDPICSFVFLSLCPALRGIYCLLFLQPTPQCLFPLPHSQHVLQSLTSLPSLLCAALPTSAPVA